MRVGIASLKAIVDADNGYYSAQAFARLKSLGVDHAQPAFERISKSIGESAKRLQIELLVQS